MNLTIKLAWRNIWRNWRRSIITIAAIFFSTLLIMVMRSMQLGTYDYNIRTAIETFTGYLQIQNKEYLDNPTLRKSFEFSDELKNKIQSNDEIKAYSPRIIADGLIGNKKSSFGAAIMAFNPDLEKNVSTVFKKVKTGQFLSNQSKYGILVGEILLENLKANIGDEIVILASGYDGSLGNLKFKIVGTVKMGQQEFDAMAVFMNLDAAKELLSMDNRVSTIAVNLKNPSNIALVKEQLNKELNQYSLKARDWEELMPEMKQMIEMDNISGIFTLGILLLIAGFGILNTINMSITERYKEFGVMLALGMKQGSLVKIVFLETMFLIFIGTIAGILIGGGLNTYFIDNPITISGEMAEMYLEYGWEPALYFSNQLSIYINTIISLITIGIIAYILPAFKLMKLEPLKGIRFT